MICIDVKHYDENNLLVNVYKHNSTNPDSLRVLKLNPVTNDTQTILSIGELASMQIDLNKSKLVVLSGNADSIYVVVSLANLAGTAHNLYFAKGTDTYTHNQDEMETPLQVSSRLYPNPFKQKLTLNIETNKQVEADVAVYNVKGQLVKKMLSHAVLSKGEHSYYWDGKDQSGNQASNGIYFMQGNVGTGRIADKVLLLK